MANLKVFNPLTPPFDEVRDDLADLTTKNHSSLDQLAWSLAGHTMDADLDMNGNDILNALSVQINATADHTITNSSDDLIITNPNSDKDVLFNVNSSSTAHNFVRLDSSILQFLVTNSTNKIISDGIMKVTGTWSTGIAASAMAFAPTITGGSFFGFYVSPIMQSAGAFTALSFLPASYSNINRSNSLLRYANPDHTVGYNDIYERYTESFTRQFFAFAGNDGSTINYKAIQIGGSVTLGDAGLTNVTFTEEMIKLSGGSSRAFGTGGTLSQKGLVFTGFGTIGTTTTVRALEADGGLFSFKSDYGTNNKMLFGAGEDAAIGYDGTDFRFDTDLVGTGVSRWSASNWTANGTANVTISNVAPAGVGTATISKWFTIKDNSGTVYYIPAWT